MRTFIMLLSGRLPLGSLRGALERLRRVDRQAFGGFCFLHHQIMLQKFSNEGVDGKCYSLGRIEVRWEVLVEHLSLSLQQPHHAVSAQLMR